MLVTKFRGELLPPNSAISHLSCPSSTNTTYTPKASFDTFENPSPSCSHSPSLQISRLPTLTQHACLPLRSIDLEWCLESLVQDGDELIVFRGVDEDVLERDHDDVREEARELMRSGRRVRSVPLTDS